MFKYFISLGFTADLGDLNVKNTGADPENSEKKKLARAQHRSLPTTHEHPWGDGIIQFELRRFVTNIL